MRVLARWLASNYDLARSRVYAPLEAVRTIGLPEDFRAARVIPGTIERSIKSGTIRVIIRLLMTLTRHNEFETRSRSRAFRSPTRGSHRAFVSAPPKEATTLGLPLFESVSISRCRNASRGNLDHPSSRTNHNGVLFWGFLFGGSPRAPVGAPRRTYASACVGAQGVHAHRLPSALVPRKRTLRRAKGGKKEQEKERRGERPSTRGRRSSRSDSGRVIIAQHH